MELGQGGSQTLCPLRSHMEKTDIEHRSTSAMGVADRTPTMPGETMPKVREAPEVGPRQRVHDFRGAEARTCHLW